MTDEIATELLRAAKAFVEEANECEDWSIKELEREASLGVSDDYWVPVQLFLDLLRAVKKATA